MSRLLLGGAGLIVACLVAAPAAAQIDANFESPAYGGSAVGVPLAGQQAFFVPTGTLIGGDCFTYAENDLGIVTNPNGGAQFGACIRRSADFARIEHPIGFTGGCWQFDVDFNVEYVGALPTTNYAGSISFQPFPGAGSIVLLMYWDNTQTAETFTIRVVGHDGAGNIPFAAGLPVPSAAFRNLQANRWYHLTLNLELDSVNALTALVISDIESGDPPTPFTPDPLTGYYLGGGDRSDGAPTGLRFYAGGGFPGDHASGNVLAFDNVRLALIEAVACLADVNFDNQVSLQDFAILLSNFGRLVGATYQMGNFDCDQDVDMIDFAVMQREFGTVCGVE
ncbi:MAG: hypothetical protein IT450_05550 [Phycisphaerales bacterium]|nr:hypothetical protein [Phycisphaerales bacterium]